MERALADLLRPFLPVPLEPFPDSLQISIREFVRLKPRGRMPDPLASLQPRIFDLEVDP